MKEHKMDSERFDDLSRKFAEPRSRRQVLGILGATVAGLFAGRSASAAQKDDNPNKGRKDDNPNKGKPVQDKPSKCYGGGSHCTNGKQCCSGICTNRQCEPEFVPECTTGADCPGVDTECQVWTCTNGICGTSNTAYGTPLVAQTAGDCKTAVCDGNGGVTTVSDDTDVSVDGNECTDDVCVDGVPSNVPSPAGTVCGANGDQVCNGAGQCGACVPGSTQSCYTGPAGTVGIGICRAGAQTCLADGSGYGPCSGEQTPRAETCNALDDDCDGVVDEGPLCPPLPNATSACNSGQCVIGTCNPEFANCNGFQGDGCETDLRTSEQHCGACGRTCPGGTICRNGNCCTESGTPIGGTSCCYGSTFGICTS